MGCCGDCCASPKESRNPIKFDPEFSGPTKNRSCTDVIWLLVFILFIAGWAFVGYYGIQRGDVRRLLAPQDSEGRKCGLDSDVLTKPYLVFFDITRCLVPDVAFNGCPTPQVCVERCPSDTVIFATALAADPNAWTELRSKLVCKYNVDPNAIVSAQQMLEYISAGDCVSYILNSDSVAGRCLALFSTEEINALEQMVAGISVDELEQVMTQLVQLNQISTMIVEDLVASRWYLLGGLLAVIIICFIYIMLLRWVVAPVLWLSLVGLLALLSFAMYLCWKNYAYYRDTPFVPTQTTNLQGLTESIFYKKETWMVLLVTVAVVLLVLLLMIVFLRTRINLAIALIKEGSKAVGSNKSTMAFPVFPWLFQCAVIAFGVIVLMFLLTIGDSRYIVVRLDTDTDCSCTSYVNNAECTPEEFNRQCHIASGQSCQNATCHFVSIDSPTYVTYLHIVNMVGFFWVMFFIQGMSDMVLASTFATWYWTWSRKDLPFFTLTGGMWRSIRYHMGTVAFGSLIITIVRVIRVILEYIDHKLKKFDNPLTRCLLCLCKCCFLCLENFLKFINKNAYIMCAVHGNNFCTSARDAFSLLMRNIVRVFVLDKVTDFIFFLSKLLISVGVGFAVYYLLRWQYIYTLGIEKMHYNIVPALILSVATYLITTLFFNVYSMAVDTLFLCFLEDCERNDGSAEKPYFMSRGLMRILGKRNKMD